jgi:hypothetical protein
MLYPNGFFGPLGWKPSFSIAFLKIDSIIALAELQRNDSTALGNKSAPFGTYGEQNRIQG